VSPHRLHSYVRASNTSIVLTTRISLQKGEKRRNGE
jgi:hypothetical protein